MRYYAVMVSSAKMPRTCWGEYRHVAVVEVVSPDHMPRMISERADGVVRVVQSFGPAHVGRGRSGRCAYSRACESAHELVDTLRREALVEQALRFGGVVDGDAVIVETMLGSERVPLSAIVEARNAARAQADAARLALSRAQEDAAAAARGLALARSAA